MSEKLELKNEVIRVHKRIISTLWNKTKDILGRLTVKAVMDKALSKIRKKYKFMEGLKISEGKLSIKEAKKRVMDTPEEKLEEAFEELIVTFFDVLNNLTGNVLADQLYPEVKKLLKKPRGRRKRPKSLIKK